MAQWTIDYSMPCGIQHIQQAMESLLLFMLVCINVFM
jgi:hypothetical protein